MDIIVDGIHYTLREQYLVLAALTVGGSFILGVTGGWIGAWFGARRGARKGVLKSMTTQLPAPRDDARTAELTRAVDAMALEIERISEGQRFLVKVLSEREAAQLHLASPPAAQPRAPGSVTPH